jgi:hypothetical protein
MCGDNVGEMSTLAGMADFQIVQRTVGGPQGIVKEIFRSQGLARDPHSWTPRTRGLRLNARLRRTQLARVAGLRIRCREFRLAT